MTHGEIFAGIAGFGLAFERQGIETVWQVEIDKQCNRVLENHFPNVHRELDIRDCGKHNLEPVDIITFGSPCQDLSIAGKRKGLEGERSGLFFEATRIIRELKPALAIWENVPGALSSNSGRDFYIVLNEMVQLGARDIFWRVFNAQYFGVPQRRRRVFLIADFRERRSGKILPDPGGMSGNYPKSGRAEERGKTLPIHLDHALRIVATRET